jgi:hypothetical protein
MDLVVSCDTSIAHLAGALGRPVWVALKKDAEWRWLRDREDSPWYPGMRLFRQKQRGVWSDVFDAMAASLRERAPMAAKAVESTTPPVFGATSSGTAKSHRAITVRDLGLSVEAPVSAGELLDKITILELKQQKIVDHCKLTNVENELGALRSVADSAGLDRAEPAFLMTRLRDVNARLWDIEDEIRRCEAAADFGPRFIALARSVYLTNDLRAELKMKINLACNSRLVEEKSYANIVPSGQPSTA